MQRSASFSEADCRKLKGRELIESKEETKSLVSRRSHGRHRRRSSQRRRSRSSGESSTRRSREEREERHESAEARQRRKETQVSSNWRERESGGSTRSRRRHHRRSGYRCEERACAKDAGKSDKGYFTLGGLKQQRVSWQGELLDHPSSDGHQQDKSKRRRHVRHHMDSSDSGHRGCSSTSISSTDDDDDDDNMDSDWARWVSRRSAALRPVPLGCGSQRGSQEQDGPGRRVVIRYSSGSAVWHQTTTPKNVTEQTNDDDVCSNSSRLQSQSSDEKRKKPKFLSSVARRLFGSAKKSKNTRDTEEVDELCTAQQTLQPHRPQNIPSPPRRKAPQVDPQKAKQHHVVTKKRSSSRQTDSNSSRPTSENMPSVGQNETLETNLYSQVEEEVVEQEANVDVGDKEFGLDSEVFSSHNVSFPSEDVQAVCPNVIKVDVLSEPPSPMTIEHLKVHTSSPDPALIAANTYSDKTLGGSRPTSSTHQIRGLATRSNNLPFSISTAARYAGISPALLKRLCAVTRVADDGPLDCELEDRETPNRQGYQALIRDHDAIRRSKSPSPAMSDVSKRTSLVRDRTPETRNTSKEVGKCCNCSIKLGHLTSDDGARQQGVLPDDTFSDIPIYDCRDFPELGVSDRSFLFAGLVLAQ